MDPLQERLMGILKAADWDSDEDESFFAEIERVRGDAVAEFTFDRTRSYYLENTSAYIPVQYRVEEADELRQQNLSASLVLAMSASEACLKSLILRPMVYGFVHQPYVAGLISDLATSHMGWERFKGILQAILREKLGIDLTDIHFGDDKKSLWEELNRLARIRNRVVHKVERANAEDADAALLLAKELCVKILPSLLSNFSLEIDKTGVIIEVPVK